MHRIVVFFVIFISLSVFFTSFTFFNKDSSNLKNNEYFDDKDEINYFIDFILTNKGLDNFIYNDSFKIKVKKLISDNIIFTNTNIMSEK